MLASTILKQPSSWQITKSVDKMKSVCALLTNVSCLWHVWYWPITASSLFRTEIKTYWTSFCKIEFHHLFSTSRSDHILIRLASLHVSIILQHQCESVGESYAILQFTGLLRAHGTCSVEYPVDNEGLLDAKQINQTVNTAIRIKEIRSRTGK